MAYSTPTSSAFKTRHPRFASVGDAITSAYLAEAATQVGTSWADADGPAGIMYLAAHLMVMEGAIAPTGTALGVGNQIKKVKAGEVETEFAVPDASQDRAHGLTATIYGKRYMELAARNGGACGAAVAIV